MQSFMRFLKFDRITCIVFHGLHSAKSYWKPEAISLSTSCPETLFRNFKTLADAHAETYAHLLQVSSNMKTLTQVHTHILITGLSQDMFLGSKLINLYAMWGSPENARLVFDNISQPNTFLWNTVIRGYSRNGRFQDAVTLYCEMQRAGLRPDNFTFPFVLKACAGLSSLREGKEIHYYIVRNGFDSDVFVQAGLINMYSKCGSMEDACQVFDRMYARDAVSWTAMIDGYVENGQANEALELFHQMQLAGMMPDSVTFLCVLAACSNLGSLQRGKWVHDHIIKHGLETYVSVGTALVEMYARCGSIEFSQQVFDRMSKRDVMLWSAMIAAYGMHGYGEAALDVFRRMQYTAIQPNAITFTCVLSACSHAGLVDEGWQYFECMSRFYCITPGVKHYACMVDLLGRAGKLDEAREFIEKMPIEPDAGVWGALLGACRIHCNIELGKSVAERLFYLKPGHVGYYVLLSNIYAAVGRWDDVVKVRTAMIGRRLRKSPGRSLIEENSRVHTFLVGDRSHPQTKKIYEMLETLAGLMKEAGYEPNTNFVLHDVENEVKEHILGTHSEKLAIAFGLISINTRNPIRITKNLRVCGDCHTATKFISKIVGREIIVRDANRFHHFKGGICSCGDYW